MKQQPHEFLDELKEIVTNQGIHLVSREKTKECLADLNLTKKNIEEIIVSLSIENYCKGPEADKGRTGEIWVFGKIINNDEHYIKLKIVKSKEDKLAKCISFHKAEYKIHYPFKNSKQVNRPEVLIS